MRFAAYPDNGAACSFGSFLALKAEHGWLMVKGHLCLVVIHYFSSPYRVHYLLNSVKVRLAMGLSD
ncbi:hypothetical protein D3C85_1573010 [compost metagenome]